MNLRCWPGCLARVIAGPAKDSFIVCDQVIYNGHGPEWTYTGRRIYAMIDGALQEAYSFDDKNLQPISEPPEPQDTTIYIDISEEETQS